MKFTMLEHFYRPQQLPTFHLQFIFFTPSHDTTRCQRQPFIPPLPLYAIEFENCNNYLVTHHYQTYKSQEAIDKYHKGFSYCHFHQELVVIT